jgi:hypothetical protein
MGRVDITDPNTANNTTATNTDKLTRIIAGLAYQLNPNCRLLADVDLLSYDSGFAPSATNYATYANRQMAYVQAMFNF